MRTKQIYTFDVLNSYFETPAGGINADWLTHQVVIFMENDRVLYDAMRTTRRRPSSVAWEGFIAWINNELKLERPGYYASNDQVKKWLKDHSAGYEILSGVIERVNAERAEA